MAGLNSGVAGIEPALSLACRPVDLCQKCECARRAPCFVGFKLRIDAGNGGGARGVNVHLSPADLVAATNAQVVDITVPEEPRTDAPSTAS